MTLYIFFMQTFFLCVQNTEMDKVEFVTYDNAEWEGKNTHSKGERVKIPLLPYNVDKKSVNGKVYVIFASFPISNEY